MYVEKFVEEPHHIEFQILGDTQGNVIHLCERECSVQRRNQKIVEESPSPFVTPELRQKMGEKAVAAAKVMAANIDEYLGYHHEISCDVEIPVPNISDRTPCGRVEMTEREAGERKHDFDAVENCMKPGEVKQEADRCLRCDHFGFGIFKGGREKLW